LSEISVTDDVEGAGDVVEDFELEGLDFG